MADSRCADVAVQEFVLPGPESCADLASVLAAHLQVGDVLALDGVLGAGKTTFVRALVTALGGDSGLVSSPTYTLMNVYQAGIPIIHIDAYRLSGGDDLEALGFAELLDDGICCIEWAARIDDLEQRCARIWKLHFEHRQVGRAVCVRAADADFSWEGSA